jgi:hypothetical protein
VVVPEALPTSMTGQDVYSWLADHVGQGTAGWPTPTEGDIYTLFLPSSVSVNRAGELSCVAFGGYHGQAPRAQPLAVAALDGGAAGDGGMARDGGPGANPLASAFSYAVIAQCPMPGSSTLDDVTVTASHELVEASTDPLTNQAPAYQVVDADHSAWSYGLSGAPDSEVGDICKYESSSSIWLDGFVVQRTWSNAAALANLDPCVPAPSDPYFGAAPDVSDRVIFDENPTLGVQIPVGTTKTVNVRLFSTGAVQPFHVTALEGPLSSPASTLQLQWDRQVGNNGDVLKLTITRIANGQLGDGSVVLIFASADGSTLGGIPTGNGWPFVVGN